MTKKLFVGGLSWGTGDVQLRAAFESFGVTDAKVIVDAETGRSRGFGFVTIADDDAAERARAELDGSELDGRTIRVNEAQDKPRRDGPRRDAPRPAPGRRPDGPDREGGPPRPPGFRKPDKRRGGRPEPTGRGEDKFGRKRNSAQRGRHDDVEFGGDVDDEY